MIAEGDKSYVLFPLGEKRFALPAETVTELARPDSVQTFPHRTPLLTGVLVRRGRIVPVCDVAQVLVGPAAPPRKFYLIANWPAQQACRSRAASRRMSAACSPLGTNLSRWWRWKN